MGVQWFVEEGEQLPSWERLRSLAELAGVVVEEGEMFISFDSVSADMVGVFNRSDEGRRLAMQWLVRVYEVVWSQAFPEPTVVLMAEVSDDDGAVGRSWWSRLVGWLRGR